jgi:hypothetical protein
LTKDTQKRATYNGHDIRQLFRQRFSHGPKPTVPARPFQKEASNVDTVHRSLLDFLLCFDLETDGEEINGDRFLTRVVL